MEKKSYETDDGRVRVAVYGTLMAGEHNERVMTKAGGRLEIADGIVRGKLYDTRWGYPAIEPLERGCQATEFDMPCAVEVYSVDPMKLSVLDHLEGYPTFYYRKTVSIEGAGVDALIYVMLTPPAHRLLITPNCITKNGCVCDWRVWRKQYCED